LILQEKGGKVRAVSGASDRIVRGMTRPEHDTI
jgi:hypothetical protein